MKSSFGISVMIHVAVVAAILFTSELTVGSVARPVIYRVDLVELPEIETRVPVPVPAEIPDLEVKTPKPKQAAVKTPEAAPPKAINIEEPKTPKPKPPEPKPEPPSEAPEPAEPAPAPEPEVEPEPERPRGASTRMEADSPIFTEYAYYRIAMRNKIAAAWSPPRASTELVCVVGFRIVRSGVVIRPVIEETSGLAFFDQTALRAVMEASPLPALPAGFPDDVVTVRFEFAYKP